MAHSIIRSREKKIHITDNLRDHASGVNGVVKDDVREVLELYR